MDPHAPAHRCSDPDPLLHLPSGGHCIHPSTWRLLLWEIVEAFTNLDDAKVPLRVLSGPGPERVALGPLLFLQVRAGIDGIDLLEGLVLGASEGVLAAEEAWLKRSLYNLQNQLRSIDIGNNTCTCVHRLPLDTWSVHVCICA